MHKNMLAAATLSVAMLTGPAMAVEVSNSFTDDAMMAPFYTDDTMTTTRSEAEVKEILSKINPEAVATLKDDCNNPMQYRRQSHGNICDVVNTM